jgi:hypothetical protein
LAGTRAALEKPENELQRLVDLAQFGMREPPDTAAEPRNIEGTDLVHEHARSAAGEFHFRPERRGHSLCRRRGDYDRREGREFVPLDNNGITTSTLFVTSPLT